MSVVTQAANTDSIVVLRDVTWQTYCELRETEMNRQVRMTFDRGRLFLLSPGRLHVRIGELLARIIFAWTEEKIIPIMSGGSTTMKSELLERGLEPDKCFYVQNEALVRGTDQYDATTDPPPDLAIEVDVTSMSTIRMPIYAEFGVPEVWRWIDDRLEVHRLTGKAYVQVSESVCLPRFPIDKAIQSLDLRHQLDETSLVSQFRKSCGNAN